MSVHGVNGFELRPKSPSNIDIAILHVMFMDQELIATNLVVVLFVGATLFKKSIRLRRFKRDLDEILQDCSSSK